MKKLSDPKFKQIFNVQTPIKYIPDIDVQNDAQERFMRAWKRFYKKAKPRISKTNQKRFDNYLKRLQKHDDHIMMDKLEIRFINKKVGYGVFAKEDIGRYAVLGIYAGVLRPDENISDENDSVFAFTDFDPFSIDAKSIGNWARFMNHSDETNVVPWEHYSEEGPRIFFTAGSDGIKKGEQLLYSYGDEYWESREYQADLSN